jgi:hypothetical protein
MTSRSSIAAPILAVLAIMAVPLVLYVAAYLCLGEQLHLGGGETVRFYRYGWQAVLFEPATWIESKVRRAEVSTGRYLPEHSADSR